MKILFETELHEREDRASRHGKGRDDGLFLVGTMEFAPGLTVAAFLDPVDGALVVQVDTPADGPESDQHERLRVHCNDATASGWAR